VITIKVADNGFILSHTVTFDNDPPDHTDYVYQNNEEDDGLSAMADMLRTINDLLGPSTSRYSKERIYVNIEPGDKYEETDRELFNKRIDGALK